LGLAESMMLYCAWLIFSGSLTQTKINAAVEAPVSGWSMGWLSAAGLVFAVSAALFHLLKLGKLLSGKLSDEELVTVQESEDLANVHAEGNEGARK
jgi:TRAP-type transport system small permease protein